MSLKFSTSGRPMIECINPACKKLHAIHRRGDYVKRAQIRVVCRSCGTKWHLNDDDAALLQNHYEQRQQELEEKKREKAQKNHEKSAKQTIQSPPEKKQDQQKPAPAKHKRKGWLDELLS